MLGPPPGGEAPHLAEKQHFHPKGAISHRLAPLPPLSAQDSLLLVSPTLRSSRPSVTDPGGHQVSPACPSTAPEQRIPSTRERAECKVTLPASPLTQGSPNLTSSDHGHPLGVLGPTTSSSHPTPGPRGGAHQHGHTLAGLLGPLVLPLPSPESRTFSLPHVSRSLQ